MQHTTPVGSARVSTEQQLGCTVEDRKVGEASPPAARKSSKRASLLFVKEILATVVGLHRDKYLLLAVIGTATFNIITTVIIALSAMPLGIEALGLSRTTSSYLFLVTALGIGAGAMLAGKFSGKNVEVGLMPIGAVTVAASCLVLGLVDLNLPMVIVTLAATGLGWGLYIVPLTAFIQFRSPPDRLGEIIAASAFLGFVGEVVRRLLWSMNDESGSVGWSAPEAVAEIVVHVPRLDEYAEVVASSIDLDPFQRGVH